MDAFRKDFLLQGMDDIDWTLQYKDSITEFEQKQKKKYALVVEIDSPIKLREWITNSDWHDFFEKQTRLPYWKKLENFLQQEIQQGKTLLAIPMHSDPLLTC